MVLPESISEKLNKAGVTNMPYDVTIKGWMFEEELQIVENLAKEVPKNGVIVEVGSLFGRSAICWAMSADPTATVYCYDPFYTAIQDQEGNYLDSWQVFQENTSKFNNIVPVRGHCPQETQYVDSRLIDVFFIDALHKNPTDWDIIEHFLPYIKPGGIIAGHDYSYPPEILFPDVNDNVARLEEMNNNKAVLNYTLWYLRKL
jgi:predicted O-methyltransferase YrrM